MVAYVLVAGHAGGIANRLERLDMAGAAIPLKPGMGRGEVAARPDLVGLLERKGAALTRIRSHLRVKALLEVWLYVHVPLTFALIAALAAHVVSVFFYW